MKESWKEEICREKEEKMVEYLKKLQNKVLTKNATLMASTENF